uniref:Variant surface glycoprotein 1125.29 n=1 Tax=Trypanosoma brucei TaxID=5691 RepID=A0A1J0R427_9TRYP|nr:variant surface glycoprotein 1125.29 [Trypanosoma brucei]
MLQHISSVLLLTLAHARAQEVESYENCSTPASTHAYAAALIAAARQAYKQERSAQIMLQKIAIYGQLDADQQLKKAVQPLKTLLKACAAAETERAEALEEEARPHILNLVQLVGAAEQLEQLAKAEIKEVAQAAHSNSAKYTKIELKTESDGTSLAFYAMGTTLKERTDPASAQASKETVAQPQQLRQVTEAAGDSASTAMCCAGNSGAVCQTGAATHVSVKGHKLYAIHDTALYIEGKKTQTNRKLTWITPNRAAATTLVKAEEFLDRLAKTTASKNGGCTPYTAPSQTFRHAVRKTLLNKPFKAELSAEDEQEITATINRVYGSSPSEYKQKIWDQIDKAKVQLQLDNQQPAVELRTINSLQQLATAYAVTSATTKRQEETHKDCQKGSSEISDKTATSCNNKNKDECNKDDKCKWKADEQKGECKPKDGEEEVKATKDDKTNSTTSNNSFVIKKAPLLLAFLLF